MSYSEAVTVLINSLAYVVGPVLGFISAWWLFILQENRKQSEAAEATRNSLIAELTWLESYLNITTIKYAAPAGIIARGVKEWRWLIQEGIKRDTLQELTPEFLKGRDELLALNEEELAQRVRQFKYEKTAIEVPVTITTSVLGTPTSAKLTSEQIKKLIDVRWQCAVKSQFSCKSVRH